MGGSIGEYLPSGHCSFFFNIDGTEDEKVIVISAMNGVTNELYRIVERDRPLDEGGIIGLAEIESYHQSILKGCVKDPKSRSEILKQLSLRIEEMKDLLKKIKDDHADGSLRTGILRDRNLDAVGLSSEDIGLVAKDKGNSVLADIKRSRNGIEEVIRKLLKNGSVPVITGYYGCRDDRKPVCFGRSGSDYTAAVMANILGAERVEIWRDVPGILSADPRLISNATRIEQISYDEAAELAFFGALILHPRTVDPLRANNIPLMICDISDPDVHTLVGEGSQSREGKVRSVSFTRDIGILKLKGPCLGGDPKVLLEVISLISDNELNLRSVMTGQNCIMMIMDRKDLARCENILNNTIVHGIDETEFISDHSLIGIVGEGIFEEHGVASRVLRTVARKGINIAMITAGPSDVAYYFIVREDDLDEAVSTIHDDLIMEIVKKTQLQHERRIRENRQVKLHTAS